MTQLSRVIGTEAVYADNDLAAAKEGAAFVAGPGSSGELKTAAWKSLESQHPLVARFYSLTGIEHLARES